MQEDAEIDFEEVMNQERQKQADQEKKDAEIARKLMEDELQRQEDEMMMKAMKYSLIDQGMKQAKIYGY